MFTIMEWIPNSKQKKTHDFSLTAQVVGKFYPKGDKTKI